MDAADFETAIARFINETFLFDFDAETTSATDLFEAGLIDSFGFVQLVSFLEETFSIEVTEDDLVSDDVNSLEGLVKMVRRLKTEARQKSNIEGTGS